MIIQSSNLNMNSSRLYESSHKSSESFSTWGENGMFHNNLYQELGNKEYEASKNGTDTSSKQSTSRSSNHLEAMISHRATQIQELNNKSNLLSIRNQVLEYLLRMFLGEDSEEYKNLKTKTQDQTYSIQEYGGSYEYVESYSETEFTSFSTSGVIKTADGRQIDLQVELNMSRSFMSRYESKVDFGAAFACVDPLVINTGSEIANVSKQTFYFDLDSDGRKEKISTLASGSGFLALDKNGDGVINDGSELFGTASGDGFKDLMAYDSDHNGWIDEADDVFSKLKIWYADGSDEPKLLTLKEAGVGAISLQNAKTNFSLNNEDNSTNAYIRSTGIFLYETGLVGTIQHVDLAVKEVS